MRLKMRAVLMAAVGVAARLGRRVPGVERPCGRVEVYVCAARGYSLCVVVVLNVASWREAHFSGRTGHNRLVNLCDNM